MEPGTNLAAPKHRIAAHAGALRARGIAHVVLFGSVVRDAILREAVSVF